jgi:hypothetical protein
METDVRSGNSDFDAINWRKGLREHSIKIIPVLVRYRVSFCTAIVPQQLLWHLRCLLSLRSVCECIHTSAVGVKLAISRIWSARSRAPGPDRLLQAPKV